MAWSANMNRGWAKGPTLPAPVVSGSRAATSSVKPGDGGTQTPPINGEPVLTTKPPVVTGTPTTDIPLPATPQNPTHPYGANYVPRTGVRGMAQGGSENNPGFQFNGRRPPRNTEETVPPPPGGNPPPPPPPPAGDPRAGGMNPDGTWRAPDQAYLDGLRNGTIAPQWAGQPGSPEYQNWLNSDQRRDALARGAVPPPPATPPPGTPPPGGQPRPQRPPRPGQPGQVSQQAAQALYSQEFGSIPHEFKGQLMDLARGGNAQAFNEALFGSNIPHEMKLRLQQLFGFGAPAPAAPAPVAQPQGVPQPPPTNPAPTVPDNQPGSPYYGAY